MAKKLIIRFTPQISGVDPALVSWIVVDSDQPVEVQRGSLDEVAARAAGASVIVLVPGIEVSLMNAQVPTQNRQKLLKAIPYLLEEQLASDVEDLFFALGDRIPGDRIPCAVVARTCMDSWMTRLAEFKLQPDVLLPDYLSLPYEPGVWTLYKDADGILLRTDVQAGAYVELDNLQPMLEIALSDAGELRPARLRILDADANTNLPDLSGLAVEVVRELFDASTFLQLAQSVERNVALNLLQGDYSRREKLGKMWRPWRPAAILAGIFIVLHLASSAVELVRYKNQSAALQVEIEQTYLATFPNEKRAPNPKVQMERHLKELRGGSKGGGAGFLSLLGGSAGVFSSVPGLELRSVRYKDGKLDIDMTISDLQALDKLKQTLTQQSALDVEILSANARGSVVESRLQLRSHSL